MACILHMSWAFRLGLCLTLAILEVYSMSHRRHMGASVWASVMSFGCRLGFVNACHHAFWSLASVGASTCLTIDVAFSSGVRNSLCNEACLLVISWEHFPKDESSRFGVAIYGATSATWPVDIVFFQHHVLQSVLACFYIPLIALVEVNMNGKKTIHTLCKFYWPTDTVRLLTHVHCKPTHFFFPSFIAKISYSLQTSFNSLMKDWADKYHVWGTPTRSPSRSNSR